MRKKNYVFRFVITTALLAVGAFIYYFYPIISLIGAITYQNMILDGQQISDSKYVGYTLNVSGSAKLGRLSNYGGGQDRYHYLLPDYTDLYPNISDRLSNVIDIKKSTQFKVVRVERSVSGVNMDTLCILKDTSGNNFVFAEECSNLEKIKMVSAFFDDLAERLKSQPFALVGLNRPMNGETLDFEVSDVALMKITSEAELIKKLCKIDNQIPQIFSMLEHDKLFLADAPLKESAFYKWTRIGDLGFYDKESFNIIFNNRKLPDEILKSIQEIEPDSIINRWILTQHFIAAKNKQFTNDFYNCFISKYQGPESNFRKSLDMFKTESAKHGFDASPKPDGENCSWKVPPRVFGDIEIVEGLI